MLGLFNPLVEHIAQGCRGAEFPQEAKPFNGAGRLDGNSFGPDLDSLVKHGV
jgi:hypothetical protein